jgi:NitT/TauT family transport system substrate-binding protein
MIAMDALVASRRAFLSGCAATVIAPALADSQEVALTKVRVSSIVSEDVAPLYYAQSAGIFRKNGLEVQFDPASGGSAVVAAVTSGAYDVGKASIISAFRAVSRGIPLVAVAPGWVFEASNSSAEMIVAIDSPVRSGADLDGKTIAVSSLNELNQLAAMAWVDKHGGDSKTLHFIELPVASSAVAVAARRVDATVLLEPALSKALAGKQVRSIGSAFGALGSSFPVSVWISNRPWATVHPEQARAFARSMSTAADYMNRHPNEEIALLATALNEPMDTLRAMKHVAVGTSLTVAMLTPLLAAAQKYVGMPPISLQDFVIQST